MKTTSTGDTGNSHLTASGAAAASSSSTTFVHDFSDQGSTPHDQAVIAISGTFTSAALLVEALTPGSNAIWSKVKLIDRATGTGSAGTDSPTDSTNKAYLVDVRGTKKLRVSNSSGTITSMKVDVTTGTAVEFGGPFSNTNTITSSAFAGGSTYTGGTGVNVIGVPDNLADALSISEGSNKYVTIVTTDGSERVKFGKSITLLDAITITNSANATGTSLWGSSDKGGFFGATPVVQQAAFTQTYSTATRTVPADTSHTITDSTGGVASTSALAALTLNDTLTDNSGGSASTTIAAISDTATKNAAASFAAENALIKSALTVCKNSITTLAAELVLTKADALATKKLVNALIDDHQAYGLAT